MSGSDSDSDIEIIDSRVAKKSSKNDIIQDLEIIENQSEPSTSKINISLSQDSSKKSMKIKIDSKVSSSKLKLVLGKRKQEDSENTEAKTKVSKSTSELHLECSFESKAETSLSTSEIVLQGVMDRSSSSSSEESEDELKSEDQIHSVSVSDCVESFLKSCQRLLPPNDYSSVQKKITKYLTKLDPKHQQSNPLKEFLHKAWSLVDSDFDNIFIHVKDVVEELKKYKGETLASSSGATTSDNSDGELKKTTSTSSNIKKRVSLTTLTSIPQNKSSTNPELMVLDKIINKPKEDIWSSLAVESSSILGIKHQDKDDTSSTRDGDKGELHSSNNRNILTKAKTGKVASDKHLQKLEKALEACARNIKKCEEAEIDWDQEESNFVMADKWKKKFMAIYNKLAECKGEAPDLERSADKRFTFTEGKYLEVNKKIEKFVNKSLGNLPDFWDIKALIEKVNLQNKLGLTDMQIHNESEKIFITVGRKLKKRRNFDDGNAFYSYLAPDDAGDPATDDPELERRLNELGKEAERKINKVFEDFVEKQASGAKEGEDHSDTEFESEEEADTGSVDLSKPTEIENILFDDNEKSNSSTSTVSCGSLDGLLEDEEEI